MEIMSRGGAPLEEQFPLLKTLGWGAKAEAPATATKVLALATKNLPRSEGAPTMRHTTWTSKRVGEWLQSLGLREYADSFAQHRVSGDLLEVLTEDHLKELGVQLVGHRLILLRELNSLKRRAHDRERHAVLWSGDEVLHHSGPLNWLKDHLLCAPCCREPDRYRVTMQGVAITKSDHMDNRFCPVRGKTTRTIELTGIVGVTAHHSSRCFDCGCAADDVVIDLNKELGLAEVPPLKVANGMGDTVAAIVRSAVEEAQGHDGGGGAHPPGSPNVSAMLRA